MERRELAPAGNRTAILAPAEMAEVRRLVVADERLVVKPEDLAVARLLDEADAVRVEAFVPLRVDIAEAFVLKARPLLKPLAAALAVGLTALIFLDLAAQFDAARVAFLDLAALFRREARAEGRAVTRLRLRTAELGLTAGTAAERRLSARLTGLTTKLRAITRAETGLSRLRALTESCRALSLRLRSARLARLAARKAGFQTARLLGSVTRRALTEAPTLRLTRAAGLLDALTARRAEPGRALSLRLPAGGCALRRTLAEAAALRLTRAAGLLGALTARRAEAGRALSLRLPAAGCSLLRTFAETPALRLTRAAGLLAEAPALRLAGLHPLLLLNFLLFGLLPRALLFLRLARLKFLPSAFLRLSTWLGLLASAFALA
jgi:hypothetical protein